MKRDFSTWFTFSARFFCVAFLSASLGTSSANEQAADVIAEVISLQGAAGVAGEPRRHELAAASKLFADKLVMLDRGAVLLVRYTTTQAVYELRGAGLVVMHRDGPLVVEGEHAIRRE